MSSISLLHGLFNHSSWRWPSQGQDSRKRAQNDARDAASLALTRSLLQGVTPAGSTPATGAAQPVVTPPSGNPLEANLGNLIDLRATLVTRTEDASLTIKTAEGDTVTITEHSQLQSLKARLTYAPGDPQAAPAAGAPGAPTTPAKNDGDADDSKGETRVGVREIQLDQSTSLSVQGSLSDQELADIKKLVSSLGDALKGLGNSGNDQAPGGDPNAQPGSLTRIDTQGLGSLAGFELHVEQSVEVTKIHVRRAPAAPPAPTTAQDPTATPASDPSADPTLPTDSPVAANPGATPAQGPAKAPVLGKSAPVTPPKPGSPAWIVSILNAKRTTVADILFQRSIGVTQNAASTDAPLPESPAATV